MPEFIKTIHDMTRDMMTCDYTLIICLNEYSPDVIYTEFGTTPFKLRGVVPTFRHPCVHCACQVYSVFYSARWLSLHSWDTQVLRHYGDLTGKSTLQQRGPVTIAVITIIMHWICPSRWQPQCCDAQQNPQCEFNSESAKKLRLFTVHWDPQTPFSTKRHHGYYPQILSWSVE